MPDDVPMLAKSLGADLDPVGADRESSRKCYGQEAGPQRPKGVTRRIV